MYQIIVHHVNFIGNVKIFSASADNKDRRYSLRFVKLARTVGKRRDRFLLYKLLHHAVADHEVSCASVLVDQEKLRTAVNRLHNVRRL